MEVDKDSILNVLSQLKDGEHYQFRQLTDIAGVDYPNKFPRFEVVYHFLDFKQNIRLRIKTRERPQPADQHRYLAQRQLV